MSSGVCFVLVLTFYFVSEVFSLTENTTCEYRRITDSKTHLPMVIGDCSGMSLTRFPYVWQYVNILDLRENKIQALDSKQTKLKMTSLQILVLSYNDISEISADFFDGTTYLTELDLSYNNITTLESNLFRNLNKLSKLDLSFNNLASLPNGFFGSLHNLEYLDLGYNLLGKFLISSKTMMSDVLKVNKNIRLLKLDGLNLTHIDSTYFDGYKQLIRLSLADNAFENIPSIPYSTEILDLSGNRFTFISGRYLNYHSLKELRLNRMPTLTNIHHYAFYNLNSLQELFINDCPNLKSFSDLAFDWLPKNYQLHPKVLSLARNGLETLNETYEYIFHNMNYIDLRHNPWRCDCNILWLKDFKNKLYKSNEMR